METEPEQGKVFDRNLKLKNKNSISKEQTKDLRQYVTIQSVDEEVLEDTDEISQSTTSAKVGNTLYIIFKYISNIYLNCFSLDFANSTNMYKKVMRVITLIDKLLMNLIIDRSTIITQFIRFITKIYF